MDLHFTFQIIDSKTPTCMVFLGTLETMTNCYTKQILSFGLVRSNGIKDRNNCKQGQQRYYCRIRFSNNEQIANINDWYLMFFKYYSFSATSKIIA